MTQQIHYRAWTDHIGTCDDCENGTPEPGDEDYVCPEGKRLKALWLDEDQGRTVARISLSTVSPPSEFQGAVVQMVMKFASAAEGDAERLANMARAQVVCGETCRSLITRSQLLNKRWDAWSYAEILDLVQRAEAADVAPGSKPRG